MQNLKQWLSTSVTQLTRFYGDCARIVVYYVIQPPEGDMRPDSAEKAITAGMALVELDGLLAASPEKVLWEDVAAVAFQLGTVSMAIRKAEEEKLPDPDGDVLLIIMSRVDARVIEQCLQTGPTVGVRHKAGGVLARIRNALAPDGPAYYPH